RTGLRGRPVGADAADQPGHRAVLRAAAAAAEGGAVSRGTRRERHGGAVAARRAVRVLGRYTACCLVLAFFSLPLLWLASAPFDRTPGTAVSLPEFTLANFRSLWDNPYAVDSLRN